ncbi:hypothetical protein ACTHOQ_14105 [Solibacillus silvestris]|uniref:hypothetical protein n=1 Tax=Solibacillus silvestris TaxID=76853 RepID=UPI003F7F5797
MPYLNKKELEHVVMEAFNEGITAAISMNHHEGTPEQLFYSLNYEEFCNQVFKKSDED